MCPRVSLGYTKTKGVFAANTAPSTPEVAPNPKRAKAPLRPPRKSRRGQKRRRFGLISAGSVRPSRESRRRWDRRSGSRSSRVWVRSIVRCLGYVKKKYAEDHKIFGDACLVCLHVVVAMQSATTAVYCSKLRVGAYDRALVEIDSMGCAKLRRKGGRGEIEEAEEVEKRTGTVWRGNCFVF